MNAYNTRSNLLRLLFRKSEQAPFEKSQLHDVDVISYAWNNNWRLPSAQRAYQLANAGYKVG